MQIKNYKLKIKRFCFLKYLLVATFVITLSLPTFKVFGDEIADPNDIFNVISPGPNQKVSGTTNIIWQMYDNEQTSVQYNANLFDAASCMNVNYGALNSNTAGVSSNTTNNTLSWNTRTTLTNSNLVDGKYCLKICAAYIYSANHYSACNSRIVLVINNNHFPTITSLPTGTTIKESADWQYQIQANDQDGDPLKYLLVMSPNFLSIDNNGLVRVNGNSKALAQGITQADYKVIVGVDDGMSGLTTQEFTISIVPDNPVVINPQPNDGGNTTTNSPTSITIISPTDISTFKGSGNKIQWSAQDVDGINTIKISYSSDLKSWTDITTLNNNTTNLYSWDVSSITDGQYYIQISVTDGKGVTVTKVSKLFTIKNLTEPTQQNPVIADVIPRNQSEISDTLPQIAGDMIAPDQRSIDVTSFKFLLDDNELTNLCIVTTKNFICKIINPLAEGKHKISIIVKDDSGASTQYDSVFTVKFGQTPVSTPVSSPVIISVEGEIVTILGQQIPKNVAILAIGVLLLCCLLLFIPWLLFTLWSGRSKHTTITATTTSMLEPEPMLDTSSLQSFSQQYPQTSTTTTYEPQPIIYAEPQQTFAAPDYSTAAMPVIPLSEPLPQIEPTQPSIQEAYSQDTMAQGFNNTPVLPAESTPVTTTTTTQTTIVPEQVNEGTSQPANSVPSNFTDSQQLQPLQPNQPVDPNAFMNYDWYQPLPPIDSTNNQVPNSNNANNQTTTTSTTSTTTTTGEQFVEPKPSD